MYQNLPSILLMSSAAVLTVELLTRLVIISGTIVVNLFVVVILSMEAED